MKNINLVTSIPGPKAKEIIARRTAATPAGLAKSTEIVVEKAQGALVWDVDGNQLLDFAGGIGMLNLGHRPEAVVQAIHKQADQYLHSCALVTTFEPYVELAELLNKVTPGEFPKKTLLAGSGSEAVENAVQIARYYTKRPAVICFEGGYHGRTHLTLSLTSKYGLFKKGFGSMSSDIYRLPVPNLYRIPAGMTEDEYLHFSIQQLENALIAQVDPEALAAILIEPVLGEAGFIPVPPLFLLKIREICTRTGAIMIADEVQCGSGRTGRFCAIEHSGVIPDMVVLAKSMGAGMPISATIGRAEIMDAVHLGGVGGTYGGSPVAAVAAIEAVKILSSPAFLSLSTHFGEKIEALMAPWVSKYPCVGDVRGMGAMRLVEFVKDKKTKEPDPAMALEIIKEAVSNGIILIRAGLYSNCIRLLPPIVMTDDQLEEGLSVLENAIAKKSLAII
jgi:4-aminobutyrate aminotransferase/(S)-3-amino-2-methylpropionate transaminase